MLSQSAYTFSGLQMGTMGQTRRLHRRMWWWDPEINKGHWDRGKKWRCPMRRRDNKNSALQHKRLSRYDYKQTLLDCSSYTFFPQLKNMKQCISVDCKWESWSEYGPCSRECGGFKTRTRVIAQQRVGDGEECTGNSTYIEECSECPGKKSERIILYSLYLRKGFHGW